MPSSMGHDEQSTAGVHRQHVDVGAQPAAPVPAGTTDIMRLVGEADERMYKDKGTR